MNKNQETLPEPRPPRNATAPHARVAPGDMVDHYQVQRSIGRGSMGEVLLARDLRLGRRVALKLVRADALGDERARGRFLREARLTAQFNHPHIVTIHDVGEWRDRPYVALEYLEGQTLRDRMEDEHLGSRAAIRIARAIASALAEAHAHQVLHRDLKPENVLLPRDGRPRVVDFGLAKHVSMTPPGEPDGAPLRDAPEADRGLYETHGKGLQGTPGYMAPEQWREQEIGPAADVWALGILLYEMLAGHRPHRGMGFYELAAVTAGPDPMPTLEPREPDIPACLSELVSRCLSKRPQERPAAAGVVSTLDRLIGGEGRRDSEDRSPYRGLLPFAERHADLFFGRSDEVAAFLERLREDPVLPVVGPSGAGKSSFIQAGVVPRLRDQGRWRVLRIRPGREPFETLAFRLLTPPSTSRSSADPLQSASTSSRSLRAFDAGLVKEEQTLAEALRTTPTRLALELARLADREQSRVLLFVDQLEELYTLVEDPDPRRAFMTALCLAADDASDPVRVIFTVRDDFLWRLAEGDAVRRVLERVTVLRPPGPDSLQDTLERPLETVGYRWDDPALPREMVQEVAGEASALPLLQFTCQQLWVNRDPERRRLTRAAYEEIGGVAGSLASHADSTLAALTAAQEHTARQLILRLVTPQGTRRRVARSDLLDGLGPDAEAVLERFTAARTVLERKGRSEAELELVHESLILKWDRLVRWLDESREERLFLSQVTQAAQLWQARGHRPEEVWQGDALRDAQARAARCEVVPRLARRFLATGERRERRRRTVRTWALAGTVLALAVVATGSTLAGWAYRRQEHEAQRSRRLAEAHRRVAERQRREAERQRADALRESARAAWARGALIETRAKLRTALQAGDTPQSRALWWQLARSPLRWRHSLGASLYDVAYRPDGRQVAVASLDHAVHLFDVDTGAERVLRGHRDQVLALAYAPGGKRLASGSLDGELRIWDLKTGASRALPGHQGGVRSLAFHPGGRWLASAGDDRTIRVWDTRTLTLQRTLAGHTATVLCVTYDRSGRWLASSAGDGQARIWDGHTLQLLRTIDTPHGNVLAVAFSADGQQLITGGSDHRIRLYRTADGHLLRTLAGHLGNVYHLATEGSGRWLASGSHDGTVRIWRLPDGALHATLKAHTAQVRAVAFSPAGTGIASVSWDHTLALWDPGVLPPTGPAGPHRGTVNGVAFSADGRQVVTGGVDKTLRVWQTATGRVIRVLRGHQGPVWGVAMHPTKPWVASASSDKTVRIWDVATGRTLRVLRGHGAEVWSVAFSRDGRRLVSGSSDETVRIWDVATGAPGPILRGHRGAVWNARFDATGTRIYSASHDGTIRTWDARTGALLQVRTGHRGDVYDVWPSRDGRRLLSSGNDRTLRVWSLAPGARGAARRVTRLPGRAYCLHPSPVGPQVAVAVTDGTVRLWNPDTGKLTPVGHHRGEVNVVRFGPTGRLVASTGDDSTVRLWATDPRRPRWRAPLLDPRGPRLYHHGGRLRLGSRGGVVTTPAHEWERAVLERARCADRHPTAPRVCLRTYEDRVELWDTHSDRRLAQRTVRGAGRVVALADACAVRAGPLALLLTRGGKTRRLAAAAVALARDGAGLLVATADGVRAFDATGRRTGRGTAGGGVTALVRVGERLVLGYRDGGLEVRPFGPGARPAGISFEDTPASAVIRLIPGPAGTLVAGFANGTFGLWSLHGGHRLFVGRLHGQARHLALVGGRLLVASSLGQHARVDLRIFHQRYCALLRQVWATVPAVWDHGRPVRRAPPPTHPCFARSHP